jgi:tripartite-type tricarboxylate transporter receptor subunit TctC
MINPMRLPFIRRTMRLTPWLLSAFLAVSIPLSDARPAAAADQLKIVTGFAAGSGIDVIARLIAQYVRQDTGMTVIIENRPGGGGRVAADMVAHAAPDGQTILLAPIVTTAFTPFMFKKLSFDPLKDLEPITRLGNFKFALAVNNKLPANTVKEFIAYVKANPGKMSFSTPGAGTPAEFLGAMFNKATGTDLVHVPYRGSGPAAAGVLAGDVMSAFNTTVAMLPLYKDGKVKILAVTGSSRSPNLPNVPALSELKLNLGEIESADLWYGFLAPGKTSPETVKKLNSILVAAIKNPKVKERLLKLDIEVITDTPEAFAKIVKQDYDRWGKVIKDSGFKLRD